MNHEERTSVQNSDIITDRDCRRNRRLAPVFFCFYLFFSGLCAPLGAQTENELAYRLAGGDQITLRVVMWNEDTRRYDIWEAVSGAYRIQPDGSLRLPIGGTVATQGQTTDDVSDLIAETLKLRVGSLENIGVSLEVVEYRPFYVIGNVNTPGSYPARPGLTVLQAFALAGGDANRDPISTLRNDSGLHQTLVDSVRFEIKAIRLRAEINGDETVTFPDGLTHPDGADALAAVLDDERAVFASRAQAYALEVANLNELKVLLITEINILDQKTVSLNEQVTLARDALDRTNQLRRDGLALASHQLEAQRQVFDLERQELDLRSALFRLQQRMKEADRDLLALRTQRVTDTTAALQDVAAELEQTQIQQQMLRGLIAESGGGLTDYTQQSVTQAFYLTPADGSENDEVRVGPERRIAPGDTLRISHNLIETDDNNGVDDQ